MTILYRALLAMAACWVVGYGVGWVAQQVVDRHIEAYKAAHPLDGTDLAAGSEMEAGQDDVGQQKNNASPAGGGTRPA